MYPLCEVDLATRSCRAPPSGKGSNCARKLIWHDAKREELLEKEGKSVVEIISTMLEVSGRTARSVENKLSLLEIPDKRIIDAISAGRIEATLGYVLAANKKHPEFKRIADGLSAQCSGGGYKGTVAGLKQLFSDEQRSSSFELIVKKFNALLSDLEKNGHFGPGEIDKLLAKSKEIVARLTGESPRPAVPHLHAGRVFPPRAHRKHNSSPLRTGWSSFRGRFRPRLLS